MRMHATDLAPPGLCLFAKASVSSRYRDVKPGGSLPADAEGKNTDEAQRYGRKLFLRPWCGVVLRQFGYALVRFGDCYANNFAQTDYKHVCPLGVVVRHRIRPGLFREQYIRETTHSTGPRVENATFLLCFVFIVIVLFVVKFEAM